MSPSSTSAPAACGAHTGDLGPDEMEAAGRAFAAGDRVIATRNARDLQLANGRRWTITVVKVPVAQVGVVDLDFATAVQAHAHALVLGVNRAAREPLTGGDGESLALEQPGSLAGEVVAQAGTFAALVERRLLQQGLQAADLVGGVLNEPAGVRSGVLVALKAEAPEVAAQVVVGERLLAALGEEFGELVAQQVLFGPQAREAALDAGR